MCSPWTKSVFSSLLYDIQQKWFVANALKLRKHGLKAQEMIPQGHWGPVITKMDSWSSQVSPKQSCLVTLEPACEGKCWCGATVGQTGFGALRQTLLTTPPPGLPVTPSPSQLPPAIRGPTFMTSCSKSFLSMVFVSILLSVMPYNQDDRLT